MKPESTMPEVQQGIEWLDQTKPDWWKHTATPRINLRTLDMEVGNWCVCGQAFADRVDEEQGVFDGFHYALNKFSDMTIAAKAIAKEHGFIASDDDGRTWANLQHEWKRVITARRKTSKP